VADGKHDPCKTHMCRREKHRMTRFVKGKDEKERIIKKNHSRYIFFYSYNKRREIGEGRKYNA
jgi:hypothetical protein